MKHLNVIAFAGASNWPLYVGQERGFFAEAGLDVRVDLTPNSRHMARELHTGNAHIALTSIDNVIAYVDGQGEEPLDGDVDFFAFMGVDDGLLSVMARPTISSVLDLRGRTIAVDAMTTGFAFAMREILAKNGIDRDDVNFVKVGSGSQRLSALLSGECDGTLLNAPLCLLAENVGCNRLIRVKDILHSYQGIVGAARRAWANTERETVNAFISGFDASLRWLRQLDNRREACSLLLHHMPSLATAIDAAYNLLVTSAGLNRSLEIDIDGVGNVLALRELYAPTSKTRQHAASYIDDSFLRAVRDTA